MNLRRSDQPHRFGEAGPETAELGMFADDGSGRRRAETQPVRVDRDRHQFRNALDVDERGRLTHAGAELHEKIRAAGQHARAGIGGHEAHGFRDGPGCFVANGDHGPILLRGPESCFRGSFSRGRASRALSTCGRRREAADRR